MPWSVFIALRRPSSSHSPLPVSRCHLNEESAFVFALPLVVPSAPPKSHVISTEGGAFAAAVERPPHLSLQLQLSL
jgi:hypothetical protein